MRQTIEALIRRAGYGPHEPIVVGARRAGADPVFVATGRTRDGAGLRADTLVYAASLSKQLTAACAALLVTRGALDPDAPLSRWLPELPAWAGAVRLRQLVHHTGALPADAEIDAAVAADGPADRTSHGVLDALSRTPVPPGVPGTEHVYSNAGYVCLAAAAARAAGRPLPDFAHRYLFEPLGMVDTRYWPGPLPAPARAAPLAAEHPAPLSLGDGGVWSTAADLMRWNDALNADRLGISDLLQTPGRLNDGTVLDYAWGMGVRSRAGHTVYRHGGGWPGLRALAARVPDAGASLVIAAVADDTERRVGLADGLLDALLGTAAP
ncbi:serine hydrolase domain-containing protein [Rugosimonospora acidiphila]|uniref:Serine hydrolase domain-containing protein n=1 Tax=Rugosimonospora acidiphila TaxID=556531 RepID=A0ABP9RJ11_9ACTN